MKLTIAGTITELGVIVFSHLHFQVFSGKVQIWEHRLLPEVWGHPSALGAPQSAVLGISEATCWWD
jgi:hypothetical protein